MTSLSTVAALLALGLASPATAQPAIDKLLSRLTSPDPKTTTVADCHAQVAKATSLNGPDLLYAASVCHAAKRPVEGNFLLVAGQVRSIPDMVLMIPASKEDAEVATSLYGVIYFYAGGIGDEEILRDAASREAFLKLFDNWAPSYDAGYDPGWAVRRRPDAAEYQTAVAESKGHRRKQLTDFATLLEDKIYYSLHRRSLELHRRNRIFVQGTADAKLVDQLRQQMNERAAALGVHRFSAGPEDREPARFPPARPAKDEVVVTDASDEVVKRCAGIAEWHAIAAGGKISNVLITRSGEWGTIWRADIGGGDEPPDRFTCTETTSASQPLDTLDIPIPPFEAEPRPHPDEDEKGREEPLKKAVKPKPKDS